MNSDPASSAISPKQGLILDLTASSTAAARPAQPSRPPKQLEPVDGERSLQGRRPASTSTAWSITTWTWPRKPASIPRSGNSLDDMWKDFDKVKAAGFQPLAVGSQDFRQVGHQTVPPIAAVAGPDIYPRLYGPTVDPKVFDEAFIQVIDWVCKFSQQSLIPARTTAPGTTPRVSSSPARP